METKTGRVLIGPNSYASIWRQLEVASEMLARGVMPAEVDTWLSCALPGLDVREMSSMMSAIASGGVDPPGPRRSSRNPLTHKIEPVQEVMPDVCSVLLSSLAYATESRASLGRFLEESIPQMPRVALECVYPRLGPDPQRDGVADATSMIAFGSRDVFVRHPELILRLHREAVTRGSILRMKVVAQAMCAAYTTDFLGFLERAHVRRSIAALKQELAVREKGRDSCFHTSPAGAELKRALPIIAKLPDEIAAEVNRLASASDTLLPMRAATLSANSLARRLGAAGGYKAITEIRWKAWCELCQLIFFGDSGPAQETGMLYMSAEQAGCIAGYGLSTQVNAEKTLATAGTSVPPPQDRSNCFTELWCMTWELLHYSAATRVMAYKSLHPEFENA